MSSFQEGNRLYAQKKYLEAIEAFLEHAHACPDEAAKAYAHAARCHSHVNVLSKPKQVATGVTLVHQDDTKSAEEYCRKALALDPNQLMALKLLAHVLPAKSPERRDVLERAAALKPDPLVLVDLGDYYRSMEKNLERAHDIYRQSQEANPTDETAYRRLADVCRRLGRVDEAKEWDLRWKEVDRTRFQHRR